MNLQREVYINSLKEQFNEEKRQFRVKVSEVEWLFTRRMRTHLIFFLNLDKSNCEKKCIRQLKLDNDELLLDETKILNYVTDYYQTLYFK